MIHTMDKKNNKCIIIAAYQPMNIKDIVKICEDDYIICADGGYQFAIEQGITPHLVIGDFDSLTTQIPDTIETLRVASEKDDTDTLLCLKYGIEKRYDEFVIVGGLGGRFDHTIANLQAVSYGYDHGKFVMLADNNNYLTIIGEDTVKVPHMPGYKLSLLAYDTVCANVSVSGVKYPLTNAVLRNSFPLGVSNEFMDDFAKIENKHGKLMVILSKD